MGILSTNQLEQGNALKIKLINDLWAAENTALDETSWARMRQRLKCLHNDMQEAMEMLGFEVDESEQTVPYPFSENGGGSGK